MGLPHGGHQSFAALTDTGQRLPSSAEPLLQVEHLFVIGGGQVYREAIASPRCGVIHFTQIQADLECDTFFPAIDPARWAVAAACCTRPCRVGSKHAAPCGWAVSAPGRMRYPFRVGSRVLDSPVMFLGHSAHATCTAWTVEVTELPPVLLSALCCRFKLWSAAPPRSEKGLTYAFLCYTAAGLEDPHLPPAMASQHEEKQVSPSAEWTSAEVVRSGTTCSFRIGPKLQLQDMVHGVQLLGVSP